MSDEDDFLSMNESNRLTIDDSDQSDDDQEDLEDLEDLEDPSTNQQTVNLITNLITSQLIEAEIDPLVDDMLVDTLVDDVKDPNAQCNCEQCRASRPAPIPDRAKKIKCSICMEIVDTKKEHPTFTPCFHGYHDACIQQWIGQNRQNLVIPCPVCKTDISDIAGYRDVSMLFLPDTPIESINFNTSTDIASLTANSMQQRLAVDLNRISSNTANNDTAELLNNLSQVLMPERKNNEVNTTMEFINSQPFLAPPTPATRNWDTHLAYLVSNNFMPVYVAIGISVMVHRGTMILVPFGEHAPANPLPNVYYMTAAFAPGSMAININRRNLADVTAADAYLRSILRTITVNTEVEAAPEHPPVLRRSSRMRDLNDED